jgi:thioredoxin reductase
MAIDTPAKIAILGAGPIGLEAALYARFLGYDVVIFEAGEVANSVRSWGHVRMFTPFGMNRSPLGLAAIQAQDEHYQPPADDALLTGNEWIERYLLPLSQTDLLADHLRLQTTVVRVGKSELLKGDMPGHADRGDFPFRLLVRDSEGYERIETADAVIDASGVFRQVNHLGHGGIPTVGEFAVADRVEWRLPDILGRDRKHYAGQHTLLVGAGYSAATNVVALAQLAAEAPGTRVTWLTRREPPAGAAGPIEQIANDRLPHRLELARRANEITAKPPTGFAYWPATEVEHIEGSFSVELSGRHAGPLPCDRILANVGFRPDRTLYEELQIHECYASEGPMKLAAALLGQRSSDCLDQKACGPQALLNPEPNFYILGAKSYGRKSNFLLSVGLEQIREVFTIIGDRPALDLYAGAHNLLR